MGLARVVWCEAMSLALFEKIVTEELLPFAGTLAVVILAAAGARYVVLRLPERGGYRGQLALFVFIVLGLLALLVALPLEEHLRDTVFQLVGIVLSAAIALSSTTFLGNLIAGGMLRTVRHFEPGDWVKVGDHFGRVTERGLLHTEIQTADRDLTTLPNMYLATNPVKVTRRSGTVISASVGLGYDVPHARVEDALLLAAGDVGLEDAYVAVDSLGDYAVNYRIAGVLKDVDRILSTGSKLRRKVLDRLHAAKVEIMSPQFVNVLERSRGDVAIPDQIGGERESLKAPEDVAFDKADAVKNIELKRATIAAMNAKITEIDARLSGLEGDEKQALEWERARIHGEAKHLADEVAVLEESLPRG